MGQGLKEKLLRVRLIIGAALIVVFLTVLWTRSQSTSKLDIYGNLEKLNGFDVSQVKGEYFLLHFWAKWCEPCAEEIPHIVEFAQQTTQFQKPLKVLAISLDPNLEVSKQILPNEGRSLPPNFLLVLDSEHKVAEGLGSYQYPETYFVDPQGIVIEKWIGPQKWNKPEVLEFFKQKLL